METATTRLYEAILREDFASFNNLLNKDPLILDRCIIESSSRSMQSPLNVAAYMGHLEMVQSLRNAYSSMCLAHDQDGRTPIHVAAVRGQVNVLEELHHANRYAAQEKTNNGESILHLCVKHNELKALDILLKLTDDDADQLLNSKDNNGNTILHLAVNSKISEIVEYLLDLPTIERNAVNNDEMTAVDIHRKQSKKEKADKNIEQFLDNANAKPAKDALSHQAEKNWLDNQRSALLVVASLIATIAFEAGINPPSSVWQDSKKNQDINLNDHDDKKQNILEGTAIWSYYPDYRYNVVLVSNTVGLITSLSVTLILISGLPCRRHFLYILRVTMWIAVTTTGITYLYSVDFITGPHKIVLVVVLNFTKAWLGFMGIILLGSVLRFFFKVIGWRRRESIKEYCKKFCSCIRW